MLAPEAVIDEEMIKTGDSYRCLLHISNIPRQRFDEIEREIKATYPAGSATKVVYCNAPPKEEFYDDSGATYNFDEEPEYIFDENPDYDYDVVTFV